jgi:hypothetical protein
MTVEMHAVPFGEDSPANLSVSDVLSAPAYNPPVAATRLPGDRVKDSEVFFRTSQVADSLRDSAKLFLRAKTVDPTLLAQMVADYESIRTSIGTFVDETLAEGTEKHCPSLGPDSSLEMVLYAATQLCRWIDAIQATPSFLISEQVKLANAREVTNKVSQALGETPAGPGLPRTKPTGQYL